MDGQVATRIQNTLLNNRVKILKLCDYYTVSAPLISKRILPMEKHKEIKSLTQNIQDAKAANTARMDSLLDFIDEVPTPVAFETFLEGVKNCEASKQFAKVLKKEAEAGNGGVMLPPKAQSLVKPKTSIAATGVAPPPAPFHVIPPFLNAIPSMQNQLNSIRNSGASGGGGIPNGPVTVTSLPISFTFANNSTTTAHTQMLQTLGTTAVSQPPVKNQIQRTSAAKQSPKISVKSAKKAGKLPNKPLAKRPKSKPKENGPLTSSVESTPDSMATDVFDFNPNASSPAPVPVPKTKTGTKKDKEKKPVIKRVYPGKVKPKVSSKTGTSGPSLTATLVYKNKDKDKDKDNLGSSGSATPKSSSGPEERKVEGIKGFNTCVPAGSPFRPKNGLAKAQHVKALTFQEAEEKQKTSVRITGFTFVNTEAVVKKINYNDKSDLFYEGCPTKEGNYLCTRKVQLKGKGKKYVCKEKHENEAYELFPRLFVTFEDSTGQMETTVYRENVEILSGKSVSEIQGMNDTSLSTEFSKAIGMNIPIRVSAEKILKKDLKTSGGKTWDNTAHILNDSSGVPPPAKKAKKAAAE